MIRRYNENEIDELASILKNDGIISVPTDTVYGICARINSIKAHDKLVNVKKDLNLNHFLSCVLIWNK